MRRVLLYACAAGCTFEPRLADGPNGSPSPSVDAGITSDAAVGTGDAACQFVHADLCSQTPSGALVISGSETIDTDNDLRCVAYPQTGGPTACLVYATSIEITSSGRLTAFGSRPLILGSASTITIAGVLDGSSKLLGFTGPGANDPSCVHTASPGNDGGGAGGGAGGSFAGRGGNGGMGDTDTSSGSSGSAARGQAGNLVAKPVAIRGGCRGQTGGDAGGGLNGGNGGSSGGGLLIVAAGQVTISGMILANGAGGDGGDSQSGGGGGGSGGMIVVEGSAIVHTGSIHANSGAGGEGGNRHNSVDINGNDGSDGGTLSAATGGMGATPFGGIGGIGTYATTTDGAAGADSIVGGGGGGGGAGYVVFTGPRSGNGTSSPPITP